MNGPMALRILGYNFQAMLCAILRYSVKQGKLNHELCEFNSLFDGLNGMINTFLELLYYCNSEENIMALFLTGAYRTV